MTRIVAGQFKGRRISVPASGTRPTTDRVRESLFNVLQARMDLDGIAVLDLYAGSGALGLEALSRGASSALLVESDRRAAAVIESNIAALGARGAVLRRSPVDKVVQSTGRPVDLVFADPPYEVDARAIERVLVALLANGWVRPGALAVIERAAGGPAIVWPDGWEAEEERRYGDTRLEFGVIA
ncbi:16S rRNA (guanine(966)-N(2))-methyltransferase RsmD [Mycobacterium sp. Root265]|uniref:16S rRNA (guanine(966)-N(2))-methyltransferase RsmD n=1 Tax=Mycobacterium sp. Root265 TaxID=1736504 RepID=UPI000709AA57|nr:16S rRNA (guanine(966)-N(2))-methyltransferase RsmD [Mycobacterium sp. Root265]KRD18156.1 16S rRNA (guanine(966)-N(2))-methyltransferase RsmD [Mycobacterium sp. Root265]